MRKYAIFIALSCAMIITICGSASAADTPSANFTANTTNGFAPLSVHFTDNSAGTPTSWYWDFGDGQSSTVQNPTHTYDTVGAYSVTLNATNDAGTSSLTRKNYITAWNTSSAFKSNNGITFYVANDAGVKYDTPNGVNQQGDYQSVYVNNSYFIARGGGGTNPIQLSTDPYNKAGQLTTTNNQSGTFYVVFSGGIGHLDDAILMLAVNGTIPDNFAFTVSSSGYTYTLAPPALSNPQTSSLTNVTYVTNALNETFTKSDFIYGPQSWKPANAVNTPIFQGESPSNNFSLMFIDLDVGGFTSTGYSNNEINNGSITVNYSFSNLNSFAAFAAYGWFSACNWGTGIPMTNYQVVSGFNVQGVKPAANFTANNTNIIAGETEKFTDTSSNNPTTWLWNFGDGSTSTNQNPTHIYNTPGMYNVTLTAANDAGNDTIVQSNFINVNYPAPVAGFTSNSTSGLNPLNVQFNDQSTGTVTSYYWDFGDGTNSTDENPTHIYNTPGIYTIIETIIGPGGNDTITQTNLITVFNSTPPSISATPDTGIYNGSQNVTLTSDQPGSLIYYTTDGSDPNNSSTRLPYSNPIPINSTTSLQFAAVNQGGVWSTRYTKLYTIDTSIPTVTADTTEGIYNTSQTVTLTGSDADTITTVYYTTDGTDPKTSNTKIDYTGPITIKNTTTLRYIAIDQANNWSPEYTQTYTIDTSIPTVTTDTTGGIYNTTQIITLTTTDPDTTTTTYYTTDGTDPLTSGTRISYTGPITIDNTTTLRYIAIDQANNWSQEYTEIYNIIPAPVANFTTNTTIGTAPLNIQFNDTSKGNVNTYYWDFGDGINSTDQNPTHTYYTPGQYTIKEIVTGLGGIDSIILTNYIIVNYPTPIASFSANTTSGAAPLQIKLTDTSTNNPTSWLWDFGDGTTSIDQNPTHTYNTPGQYTIKETVTGHGGNSIETMVITAIDTTIPTASASIKGGAYNTTQNVNLSMSEAGSIYYTTNGSTPTITSQKYSGPISISSTTNLKFIAIDLASNISNVYTVNYTIDKIAPTASASLNSGLYNTNKVVTLSISKNGTIYYTTNGVTPTTTSKKYTGPITITSTTNLKFMAVDLVGNKSPVYTKTYTIDKIAPNVVSTNPKNGAINVSTTSTITVKFSENIRSGVNWSKIYMKNLTTGKLVSIDTSINGTSIIIKMTKTRYRNSLYQLYIPTGGVKDNAGNSLKNAYTFKFKTN